MTDQKAAVYPFDIANLISTGRFADRFSYSSYFVPVRLAFKDDPATPILTFPQRQWISRFASKLPDEVMDRWLDDLDMSRLRSRNDVEILTEVIDATSVEVETPTDDNGSTPISTPEDTTASTPAEAVEAIETLAEL